MAGLSGLRLPAGHFPDGEAPDEFSSFFLMPVIRLSSLEVPKAEWMLSSRLRPRIMMGLDVTDEGQVELLDVVWRKSALFLRRSVKVACLAIIRARSARRRNSSVIERRSKEKSCMHHSGREPSFGWGIGKVSRRCGIERFFLLTPLCWTIL